MSVRKFRCVEDIPETWLEPGSAELSRAIKSIWSFGQRSLAPHFPPGVYKHRSLEDLHIQEESWDARNFEDFHARRRGGRAGS